MTDTVFELVHQNPTVELVASPKMGEFLLERSTTPAEVLLSIGEPISISPIEVQPATMMVPVNTIVVNTGGGGGVNWSFAYGDATPRLVTTIPAGSRVTEVDLFIDVAFNGAAPLLQLGTLATHDLLFGSEVDPALASGYELSPNVIFGSATEIYLFITPGAGASTGSGSLTIKLQ